MNLGFLRWSFYLFLCHFSPRLLPFIGGPSATFIPWHTSKCSEPEGKSSSAACRAILRSSVFCFFGFKAFPNIVQLDHLSHIWTFKVGVRLHRSTQLLLWSTISLIPLMFSLGSWSGLGNLMGFVWSTFFFSIVVPGPICYRYVSRNHQPWWKSNKEGKKLVWSW